MIKGEKLLIWQFLCLGLLVVSDYCAVIKKYKRYLLNVPINFPCFALKEEVGRISALTSTQVGTALILQVL